MTQSADTDRTLQWLKFFARLVVHTVGQNEQKKGQGRCVMDVLKVHDFDECGYKNDDGDFLIGIE